MTKVGNTTHKVYLTPDKILNPIRSVESIEIDPCACEIYPTRVAPRYFTEADDGLSQDWEGFFFCNPPFVKKKNAEWMRKCHESRYGGISLTFSRTDSAWFYDWVFARAKSLIFLRDRITFLDEHLQPYPDNCGGPMVLAGWGQRGDQALRKLDSLGIYLKL